MVGSAALFRHAGAGPGHVLVGRHRVHPDGRDAEAGDAAALQDAAGHQRARGRLSAPAGRTNQIQM